MVLSAGFASAEITMSGSANMGLKYDNGGLSYAPAKKAAGWYEIDMDVVGTTETDSGLTFGARIQLDSDYANGDTVYGAQVFTSGSFGKFTVGAVDPMADDLGLTDIGFDGIGVDDVAEASNYTGSADARWDYSVGALAVGVSLNTVAEDYGVKAAYDFGTVSVAAAYDHDESLSNNSTSLLLKGGAAGINGEIYYAKDDITGDSYGVYAAYKTGALTFEAAYGDNDAAADAAYGIGAKYDLGGATLAGGVGKAGGDTVAELGVSFSF
ncbi:porin [Thioclava sp. A2]|uniref:porin n=1 Tax=Thioclava sp. FCG-A2 TaxID=3080562 RepID=UPI0029534A26|nr:porin [Thioclava sp. A2]MDV7272030.1 porin [Thioclava sp. A2]